MYAFEKTLHAFFNTAFGFAHNIPCFLKALAQIKIPNVPDVLNTKIFFQGKGKQGYM